MKKISITRHQMIKLAIAAKNYINQLGVNADKVASTCEKVMDYAPNEKALAEHDKKIAKMGKVNERALRDFMNDNASIYTEGDKKGTFILDDKGGKVFTPEAQKKINKEVDEMNDKYEETVELLMNSNVDFYVCKASELPKSLSAEYKKSLALLI